MSNTTITCLLQSQNYTCLISDGKHQTFADEPASLGGVDKGFTPNALLAASLASCTTITMKMYVDRKGWPIQNLSVKIEEKMFGEKLHLHRKIQFNSNLDSAQISRILKIADKCPVHKTLSPTVHITTELMD